MPVGCSVSGPLHQWLHVPFPTPFIVLPTISCAKVVDENCKIAPIALIVAPTRNVFFRPSLSPKTAANRHPIRFPSYALLALSKNVINNEHTEKMLVNVPSITGF